MSDSNASPSDRVIKCRHAKPCTASQSFLRASDSAVAHPYSLFCLHPCCWSDVYYAHALICFEPIPFLSSYHLINKEARACPPEPYRGGRWWGGSSTIRHNQGLPSLYCKNSPPPPPLAKAFPHFVMGMFLPLCTAKAIVRHPVLHELHWRSPLLAVVSRYWIIPDRDTTESDRWKQNRGGREGGKRLVPMKHQAVWRWQRKADIKVNKRRAWAAIFGLVVAGCGCGCCHGLMLHAGNDRKRGG